MTTGTWESLLSFFMAHVRAKPGLKRLLAHGIIKGADDVMTPYQNSGAWHGSDDGCEVAARLVQGLGHL